MAKPILPDWLYVDFAPSRFVIPTLRWFARARLRSRRARWAERLQYGGFLRREDANAAILKLAATGTSIKEIVRLSGHSRGLVRRILRGQQSDVFRIRESSLEHHLQWLDAQWLAGHHNGAELWRRLKSTGFRGSLRVVAEWATSRRRRKGR